jgi:hypothetical protein
MQMQSGEFSKALQSYCLAIEKQQTLNQLHKGGGIGVDGRMNFVLGTRYYLKGLAMFQLIKKYYDNFNLLKDRIRLNIQEKRL